MNQEPTLFLLLADEHASTLPHVIDGLSEHEIDEFINHSLQAIILAAVAVESAVNIAIAEPLCQIVAFPARNYFANMFRLASRTNIREKVAFLFKNRDGLTLSKNDKAEIKSLFDWRNAIVHSTPEYEESIVDERVRRTMPPELANTCGEVLFGLRVSSKSTDFYEYARRACGIARRFLKQIEMLKAF
jgi:hypothetical protein